MAGVQRGVFTLVGLFEFHSISLCGRLDSLPRRTTFGFRNALHLLEARDSVAYVRGIFQRFLSVALGKRTWLRISDHELAWLALPLLFLLSDHPYCARTGRPGLFTTVDYGSFSSFWRVVWLMSSSRVDSAMRGSSISFLTRASVALLDSCLGSFLCILARCHESKGITGQFGTGLPGFRIVFIPSSFEQSGPIDQSAKRSISSVTSVKRRAAFHTVRGLDYRRRTVSEDRRRV